MRLMLHRSVSLAALCLLIAFATGFQVAETRGVPVDASPTRFAPTALKEHVSRVATDGCTDDAVVEALAQALVQTTLNADQIVNAVADANVAATPPFIQCIMDCAETYNCDRAAAEAALAAAQAALAAAQQNVDSATAAVVQYTIQHCPSNLPPEQSAQCIANLQNDPDYLELYLALVLAIQARNSAQAAVNAAQAALDAVYQAYLDCLRGCFDTHYPGAADGPPCDPILQLINLLQPPSNDGHK